MEFNAIEKKKTELQDCPADKKVVLIFKNGEQFSGILKECDGEEIILESFESGHVIGLPFGQLSHYLEETETDEEQ